MNVSYRSLFTIDLLHEYFADSKCRGLEIIPAPDCAAICKKMDMQVRSYENKLQVFIRENEEGEPFGNAGTIKFYHKYYDTTVFRFYIRLIDPEFLNYTNIEYNTGNRQVFYFSNLAANELNGSLYLSSPVKEYETGITYVPGNLVKDPADGYIYECIKKNVAVAISKKKNPLIDSTLWTPKGLLYIQTPPESFEAGKYYRQGDLVLKPDTQNVYESAKVQTSKDLSDLEDAKLWTALAQGQLQYVTSNDCTLFCGNEYVFKTETPVTAATVDVFKFNYDSDKPAYNVAAIKQQPISFQKPVSSIAVNLAALPAGKYVIKVNEETVLVYHDPLLNTGNIIGVIEIFNHLPAANNYALLGKAEKIKSINYRLRFANRMVLWKYVRKDGKAKSIVDTNKENNYVFSLSGDDFVSATPIPLTQTAVKTLKLEFNTKDVSLQPLPNPRIEHISKYRQNDYDYYCGEVYLNY